MGGREGQRKGSGVGMMEGERKKGRNQFSKDIFEFELGIQY